ncbi:hypothetical protein GCM10011487_06090 [Steroidobacter agaridevorans]|uniref:Uncharacterized protein n=1 Tax=Steroidobacter agaridevorans TaxID=2695856 RepID=A0A829Y5V8_9GAMM|nr:hypothetical protein GCM10011487_06090 [Steroidobacter agaridevorans]
MSPQTAADAQAILARQHQVQHDQVRSAAREHIVHAPRILGCVDLEAFTAHEIGNHLPDFGIVFDYE